MRRPLFHHHKHTGKLIHHRHTSYPVLVALAIVVGGLIFMTSRVAKADDLLVTATVPAPIPATAASFTAPLDHTVTRNPSVNFRGNCPVITPAITIVLYEGSTLLGSGICQANGTFTVVVSLTPGAHAIIATVVTITGDNGQSSAPLHVTYTPSPTDISTPTGEIIAPLDILSEKPFLTFRSDLKAEWRGRFTGGVPPYVVTIHWGDGKSNTYKVSGNDLQAFTHQYRQDRVYAFSISVEDANGVTLKRNYVAMRVSGAPTGLYTKNNFTSLLDSTLIDPYIAWIAIYLCLLMTMLLMWRYEHTHYPFRVIGVPVHYPWQKHARSRKPRSS